MVFSYIAAFIAVCQFEAQHVPKKDRFILTQAASSQCVIRHTECMVEKLKRNTGWKHVDIELKTALCINDLERKRKRKLREQE